MIFIPKSKIKKNQLIDIDKKSINEIVLDFGLNTPETELYNELIKTMSNDKSIKKVYNYRNKNLKNNLLKLERLHFSVMGEFKKAKEDEK